MGGGAVGGGFESASLYVAAESDIEDALDEMASMDVEVFCSRAFRRDSMILATESHMTDSSFLVASAMDVPILSPSPHKDSKRSFTALAIIRDWILKSQSLRRVATALETFVVVLLLDLSAERSKSASTRLGTVMSSFCWT